MSLLLSVTFACGLVISVAHVINRRFVAPGYDVVLNLTAFTSAVAASLLLDHWIPAALSAVAVISWLGLARRTLLARRYVARGRESSGTAANPSSAQPASTAPAGAAQSTSPTS